MTPAERKNLHDLHSEALRRNEQSAHDDKCWPDAHAADKAFTDALYAVEVTE